MNKKLASQIFLVLLAAVPLLLPSCAAPAAPSAMVPTDAAIHKTHSGTVAVAVSGGKQTNPLWTSQVSNEDFKQALEDSLLRYKVFSRVLKSNGADYRVEVALQELKQPFVGFSLTVKSKVHWRLINAKTGGVVWQKTIDGNYTAGVGDAFVAVRRLKLANEGAIRENIKTGIQEVGQLSF